MTNARYPSTCPVCENLIERGAPIGRAMSNEWAHSACAMEDRQRALIASGETFRSRKPSDWRRRSGRSKGKW